MTFLAVPSVILDCPDHAMIVNASFVRDYDVESGRTHVAFTSNVILSSSCR